MLLHAGQEGRWLKAGQDDLLGAQHQSVHQVAGQAVDVEHGDDGQADLLLLTMLQGGEGATAAMGWVEG